MSTQMVIELPGQQATQTVLRAIDLYKTHLRASIARTQRRLTEFENATA